MLPPDVRRRLQWKPEDLRPSSETSEVPSFDSDVSAHPSGSIEGDEAVEMTPQQFISIAQDQGLPTTVWEDAEAIHIEVEVAGADEPDLSLGRHQQMLVIRLVRRPPQGIQPAFDSRRYGIFHRVVPLPEAVTDAPIRAQLANGILHIVLAKPQDFNETDEDVLRN